MPPIPWITFPPSQANGNAPSEGLDLRRLYEEAESTVAQAMERLVAHPSFGILLAQVSENVIALSRIASDSADLALSNLRIAGRRDVVRLERQLGRSEDKLETLLQELESLRDELSGRGRRAEHSRDALQAAGDAPP